MNEMLNLVFSPNSPDTLALALGFWVCVYLVINLVWDIGSKHTPSWSMGRFRAKIETVFHAGTFASGFMLLLGTFQPDTRAALFESNVALMLPAIVCILHALSNLSPTVEGRVIDFLDEAADDNDEKMIKRQEKSKEYVKQFEEFDSRRRAANQ